MTSNSPRSERGLLQGNFGINTPNVSTCAPAFNSSFAPLGAGMGITLPSSGPVAADAIDLRPRPVAWLTQASCETRSFIGSSLPFIERIESLHAAVAAAVTFGSEDVVVQDFCQVAEQEGLTGAHPSSAAGIEQVVRSAMHGEQILIREPVDPKVEPDTEAGAYVPRELTDEELANAVRMWRAASARARVEKALAAAEEAYAAHEGWMVDWHERRARELA